MKEGYKKDGFHPSLSDKFNYDEIDALMKGFGSGISKLWETCDPILKSELVTRSRGDLELGIKLICKEI